MSKFMNPALSGLEVYTPGEQPQDRKYIKLNTNESPYPPSPEVLAAVNAREAADLRLYSDPESRGLKQALAARYGVEPENVFLSNGSDDILNFAFLAFAAGESGTGSTGSIGSTGSSVINNSNDIAAAGRKAWFPDITYGFYPVFTDLHRIEAVQIPLKEDFSIDPADYCVLGAGGGLISIANPNAPTGLTLTLRQIEDILRANPDKVVLIDEAYVDFGAQSALPLIRQYENLLIVQTFSKSRSMAGARLGFALAQASLIQDLETIKFSTNPYNINRLTSAAGIAALASDTYFEENCEKIMKTRHWTKAALEDLGFTVLPSAANFLFARADSLSGMEVYQQLKARGILIRHFEKTRIRDFNRITIGTQGEMEAMIAALREILQASRPLQSAGNPSEEVHP